MKFYKYGKKSSNRLQFAAETNLDDIPLTLRKNFYRFAVKNATQEKIEKIILKPQISGDEILYIEKNSGVGYVQNEEGFLIRAEGNFIVVYYDSKAGMINGLMTFLHLLDDDSCFEYEYIWDYPFSSFRGIKVMMPGRSQIDDFKDFVDTMVYYRHNTIMIEIGGAMEYKRHPEINEGWEEYAAFMSEYSGKSHHIQNETYPWRKNSIHSDNGGGSYLSQEEVKELIAYCEERGIEVIPEVPSTSHCDYLLTRHSELAERPEDPYPDTFCPSNPESYKLLFDVFDEVIEVFNPKIINIGHDEYYSINVCDRCRKRLMDTSDIFAEDLIKIYDYLKSKNVKTMFWCDKLQNVETENGANFGGALNMVYFNWNTKGKLLGIIHPTWMAREKLPKDIICMNWFWSFGAKHDEEISEFPVVFGNFRGYGIRNFKKRCGDNVSGGMCSNWGATIPLCLQRNHIYSGMAYNDIIFWNTEYDDNNGQQFAAACQRMFEDLYRYKNGTPLNYGNDYIEVLHTTNRVPWYRSFVDGVYTYGEQYEADFYLGDYNVSYEDESVEKIKIYLGEHLSAESLEWYGKIVESEHQDDVPGEENSRIDARLVEVSYSAVPQLTDGKIFYRCLLKNPCPGKKIKDVKFVLAKDASWTFDYKILNIGIK